MKIEKIRDDVYIKKGWDGYRVVHPIKKDLDRPFSFSDNINWKNFIGRWHFWLKGFIFLLILYLFVQAYLSDTATCREYASNFSHYCPCLDLSYPKKLYENDYLNITLTFPNETIT